MLALPGLCGAMGPNNPPIPMSVAAEGMGNAVVADGAFFNATAFNPALLSNAPNFAEIRLGFGFSNDILGVANYLTNSNNLTNLQNSFQNSASYIQDITQGLSQASPDVAQVNQGINGMQKALSNLQAATSNLTGKTIQLGTGFSTAMKFDDHWGFQVYGNAHAAFQVNEEGLAKALQSISTLPNLQGGSAAQVAANAQAIWNTMGSFLQSAIPSQAAGLGQAVTTLQSNQTSAGVSQFANTVSNISNTITQSELQQTLLNNVAAVTSLVYMDVVAMATYSLAPLGDEMPLTAGANFKLVHRNIAYAGSSWLSQEDLTDFSNVGTQMKNDLEQSTLRWGLDLGLLYEFKEERLAVGLSAQDILHSSATINTQPGDPLYGIVTDPAPTVVAVGGSWHPIHGLSLNADLDDLFSNTSTYQGLDYFSHVKLGAAYNVLGFMQVRGGFSNNNLSAGVGVPFLGLDYAFAVDDLSQSYNHYLQFKVIL